MYHAIYHSFMNCYENLQHTSILLQPTKINDSQILTKKMITVTIRQDHTGVPSGGTTVLEDALLDGGSTDDE